MKALTCTVRPLPRVTVIPLTLIDHYSSDIRHLLVTASVLVLRVHGEVRQGGGDVARFSQSVRAGAHVVVGVFVKSGVMGVPRY